MSQKGEKNDVTVELTPLEKIEALYAEIVTWYGEAAQKEQRAAAKLLMVALDKLAIYEGNHWEGLVKEYVEILKQDPERFEKIMLSNRGELKNKQASDKLH